MLHKLQCISQYAVGSSTLAAVPCVSSLSNLLLASGSGSSNLYGVCASIRAAPTAAASAPLLPRQQTFTTTAAAGDAHQGAADGAPGSQPPAASTAADNSTSVPTYGQPAGHTSSVARKVTPPGMRRLAPPSSVLRDLKPPLEPYTLVPKLAQPPTSTPALYTPWTPTRALQRRSHISKRMSFLVSVLEREQMERVSRARPLPDFKAGDVLEVKVMVPEVDRRVVLYRGVCIARYDKGIRSTFKLYNVYPDAGGIVQHFPLYMPDLLGIRVVGRVPARQERLFHLLEDETSKHTYQSAVQFVK